MRPVPEKDVLEFAKDFEPDVVIEQVGGSADTIQQAMTACRPGGRIIVVGLFAIKPEFDASALVHKELRIMGSKVFGQSEHGPEFRASTKLLPKYKDELHVLQTHRFPLSKIEDAFACAADKTTKAIKVVIEPGA